MMKGTVKIQILHADGRREKLGVNVNTGLIIPLSEKTIGFNTGCSLCVTNDQVRIVSDKDSPPFTFHNEVGNDFEVKVGDIWQGERSTIEFLLLPQPEASTEESTRYVDLKTDSKLTKETLPGLQADPVAIALAERNAHIQALEEAHARAQAKPDDQLDGATSIILKMNVPKVVVEAPAPGFKTGLLDIKGHAEEGIDRQDTFTHGSLALLIIIACSETAAKAVGWLTAAQLVIPFGFATGAALGIVVFTFLLLKLNFSRFRSLRERFSENWKSDPLDTLRRCAWVTGAAMGGISLLTVIGTWGTIYVQSFNKAAPAQTPVAAQPATQQVATAPSAAPAVIATPTLSPEFQALSESLAKVTEKAAIVQKLEDKGSAITDQDAGIAKQEYFSALRAGDMSLVERLVEKRMVDVNLSLDAKGKSGLHIAAALGDMDLLSYLLSKRANINARDSDGSTPLMWAVFKRQEDVVKYLVRKGADLAIRRDDGSRAIDIAKRYGLRTYARYLTPEGQRALASERKRRR